MKENGATFGAEDDAEGRAGAAGEGDTAISSSSSSSEETSSQLDRSAHPKMDRCNNEPTDNASPRGDERSTPIARSTDGHSSETKQNQEEKVLIIDDPIILPAKSIQTRVEVIGDVPNNDASVADFDEHAVHERKGLEAHTESIDNDVEHTRPFVDSANNPIPLSASQSAQASIDDAKSNTQDVSKNEQLLGARDPPEIVRAQNRPKPTDGVSENDSATTSIHEIEARTSETEVDNEPVVCNTSPDTETGGSSSSSTDESGKFEESKGIKERQSSIKMSDESQSVDQLSPNFNSSDKGLAYGSDVPMIDDDAPSGDADATADGNATIDILHKKDETSIDDDDDMPRQIKLVDYASKLAGAQILEQSSSLKGASNLLTSDRDRYSIAPCEDRKYVVIGLSEDILVKQIKLSNYERYSSRVKEFQVLASQEYPTTPKNNDDKYWNSIGLYKAQSKSGEQIFDLSEPAWARYLKFRFLSHYGSEHYCTLTQICVHGSTMLQGFHEQWIENEKNDIESKGAIVQEEGGGEDEVDVKSKNEGEDKWSEEKGNDAAKGENDTSQQAGTAIDHSEENDEITIENITRDGPHGTSEITHDGEDSPATSVDGAKVLLDDKSEPSPRNEEELVDTQEAHFSQEEIIRNSIQTPGTDNEEMAVSERQADRSSPELNVDSQGGDGGEVASQQLSAEAKDDYVDSNKTPVHGSALVDDYSRTSNNSEGNTSDVQDILDDIQTQVQADFNASITASEDSDEGQMMMRNDSSITAVTDVVGAIKNATSDAIKNVKDAIRTRTAPPRIGDTDKEDKSSTVDGKMSSGSDGVGGEGSAETLAVQNADNMTGADTVAPQDFSKTIPQEGSSSANNKPEKETPKKDSKTANPKGQSLPHQNIDPALEKDGHGTNASIEKMFTKLFRRFPNASCLADLDYKTFKSKLLQASNASGGVAGSGGSGGAKMEPIFAKITNEIKSVQITQNQHEQYVSVLKVCYETIIWDMVNELDSIQSNLDQRLSSLERAVFLSEMSTSPVYGRVTHLFPKMFAWLAVPSFQVIASPSIWEGLKALYIGLAIFLFVLMLRLFRRNTTARRGNGSIVMKSGPEPSNLTYNPSSLQNDIAQPKIAGLSSRNEWLNKQNGELAVALAHKEKQLGRLQGQNAMLEREHMSLQERNSQLELVVSTLENQAAQQMDQHELSQKSKRELKQVVIIGESACSTPTPSVQSEPVATEICTPPKAKPGKRILKGDSNLKHRFRKNKSLTKNKQ